MQRPLVLASLLATLGLVSCGGGGGYSGDGDSTNPPAAVASVTVSPGQVSVEVGQSHQLTATAQDQAGNPLSGRSITWQTADPAIASVSAIGIVLGVGAGSTTITATSEGQSDSATVSVTPASTPVAFVTIAPGALRLLAGQTQQLTAVSRDVNGNPLANRTATWVTTEPTVVTVSSTGMTEALSLGSATITATVEGRTADVEVSVVGSAAFSSIVAGGAHTCALTSDGAAYCWGRGESGQLGVAPPSTTCPLDPGPLPCSLVPVAVNGGLVFEQLAGGGAHTCGLTSDGTAYCWGRNTSGEPGDNSIADRHAPVPVATALKFVSIDAGARHTCGRTAGNTAYCWGGNGRGQLGDGTTTMRSTPVAVAGGHAFQQVVAGGFEIGHTCGLIDNGAAYCWGDNERGQLGIGSGGFGSEDLSPHPLPALVSGSAFVQLSAGLGRHTCGLTEFASVWCWGENSFGALGDGSTSDRPVPVRVSGTLEYLHVIAGGFIGHTCGSTATDLYCWGDNERGAVGDGTVLDRLTPSAVAGSLSLSSLDAGFRHTCGRATSGFMYCWGSGAAGQLGWNSTSSSTVPVAVQDPP